MELKTLKDIDKLILNVSYEDWAQLGKTNDNNLILIERKATQGMKDILKKEATNLIEKLKRVPYARTFCLGCGTINKGQYCQKGHPLEWGLSEQTGDITAVIGFLSWFNNFNKEEKQ